MKYVGGTLLAFLLGFCAFGAEAAFDSAAQATQKELSVERVTPAGDNVPAVGASARQIVFQFNRPVVPVGNMARQPAEIPVTIEPKVECEWRWLNTSALSCNLGEKQSLAPATTYRLTMNPGIKAEDGAVIAAAYSMQFTTERPNIENARFKTWRSPAYPVIRLTLNQPVTRRSLEAHVFLAAQNDANSRVAITAQPDRDERQAKPFWHVFDKNILGLFKAVPGTPDEQLAMVNGEEARRIWMIVPAQELALDTGYVLKLEPGLVSASGPETGNAARDVVSFDTYPEFRFLGIACHDTDDKEVRFVPGQPAAGKCDPLAGVGMVFSTPVDRAQLKKYLTFTPDLAGGRKDYDPWDIDDETAEGEDGDSSYTQPHTKGREYSNWLPAGLKANMDYHVGSRPEGWWKALENSFFELFGKGRRAVLEDQFGRRLSSPIDLGFATGHRSPNYEFPYDSAVLESGVESEVPLYVNNLQGYAFDYSALFADGKTKKDTFHRNLPGAEDVQFAVPLGLREMLEGKSGAVYGTLGTTPSLKKYQRPFFAQVTPYDVHVKLGHFNTLVWVIGWADGKPVEGAKVSVYLDSYETLLGPVKPLASAVTDRNGLALLPGTESLDPEFSYIKGVREGEPQLFAAVRKNADQALVPLDSGQQIDMYRASGESITMRERKKYGHMHSWGTTAEGIYRSGDTVDYKIYVRQQDNQGFVPPPKGPYQLKVIDPRGKVVYRRKDVTLSDFGALSGSFVAPKTGAVGWYRFKLSAQLDGKEVPEAEKEADDDASGSKEDDPGQAGSDDGADADDHADAAETEDADDENSEDEADSASGLSFNAEPLRVLIADFTPSPFKVTNSVNGERFGPGETIDVETDAKLHAGGPYAHAASRVTALLKEKRFSSKDPRAQGFVFGKPDFEREETQIFQAIDQVNDKGEQHTKLPLTEQNIPFGTLTIESSVRDERGKYVSARASAEYVGAHRFVGLKSTEWLYPSGKEIALASLVTDEKGELTAGSPYNVLIERQETKAARVKGAGNAYLTNYTYEWEKVASCDLTSQTEAQPCRFTPDKAGDYRATASVKDSDGRSNETVLRLWVTGSGYVQWSNDDTGGLEILPEKTGLKIGDTARYLIKNPYPGGRALITVERYGVLDSFEQVLDGSTPVIEFPVKPDYVPGFYLSVTVFSPRVEKPAPAPGSVDLGKPAFRMGYLTVPVDDAAKAIVVTAKADKEVYRPRDKVILKLHAEPKLPGHKEPLEVTLAVLDDSVFDLITAGKAYFDPYKGFYTLDGIDIGNYDLAGQLVGRQKFEKKGATPGGDGGASLSMRNDFRYVSYWNAGQVLDADGNATLSFAVPDNLTSWHVLAMAVSPSDRMGLGEASFKVNRPTELRAVMPNQVMEGDDFTAGFSVMNRTDKPRDITVTVRADGLLKPGSAAAVEKKVTLAPYQRETIELPLTVGKVPEERGSEGSIHFVAKAGDASDRDGTEFTLPVKKWRSLETAATYGTTTEARVSETIAFPKDIHTDVGQVSAVLSPSVIGNLAGAFKYIRDYAYQCWEQKLTKAVMAAHYKQLRAYLPNSLRWPEADGLTQATLIEAASFQAPNGGMTYFTPVDTHADPYLSAFTALSFGWLDKDGYRIPEDVESKLDDYLLNLLKQDAMPTFYDSGMASTVRAVALAALADKGEVTLADLERYRSHLAEMSLFGKTHFLLASLRLHAPADATRKVAEDILSHSNESGGKITFSEQLDDSYKRMLSSPLRENCVILEALSDYGETAEGKTVVGDLPVKLARSITQTRGNRDHWENTQENLFCLNALSDYARVYEAEKPAMEITAALDAAPMGKAAFQSLRDKAVTLATPITPKDPGRTATLSLNKTGGGRLYYSARLEYAPTGALDQPINAGIEVHREYEVERDGKWVLLTSPMQMKRGELVKIDLFLSLPTARNFVVVDDAVPGGLEPVNRDLATSSVTDAKKGEFKRADQSWFFHFGDWSEYEENGWNFYHQELRHDSARFYADYLPAGNYHLSYTAQAIAEGRFAVLPLKAEEMYDPDIFGKTPAAELQVGADK